MCTRTYFTLFRYDHNCNMWVIEFGDYDRAVVAQKRRDTMGKRDMSTIVCHLDTAAALTAIHSALNQK